MGSGSEGLQQPEICSAIIEKTKKEAKDVTVLYLGTATYDLPQPKKNQTFRLLEAGCKITEIICDRRNVDKADMERKVEDADVILVSGGNTLYAADLWNAVELTPLLKTAMQRGAVLTGGSAGAICWFDAGHSDSTDPDSFKDAMLKEALGAQEGVVKDESSAMSADEPPKEWQYIRVPCLGFLPGSV